MYVRPRGDSHEARILGVSIAWDARVQFEVFYLYPSPIGYLPKRVAIGARKFIVGKMLTMRSVVVPISPFDVR